MSDITVDVAVIGAGPAGIAAGVGAKGWCRKGCHIRERLGSWRYITAMYTSRIWIAYIWRGIDRTRVHAPMD